MSEIQSMIYALEVGSLRLWLMRAGILALIGGIGAFYYIRQFNGLSEPKAMEQAQLARQIAQGEGYTTKMLHPFVLKRYRNANADQAINPEEYPDLVNAPGYPVALGIVFKLVQPNFALDPGNLRNYDGFDPEKWIVLFNIGCLIVSVGLFYVWMLRAFDDRVALVGSFLFVLTDAYWVSTVEGLDTPLCSLFICLMGLTLNEALVQDENENYLISLAFLAVASLCGGLLALTNYVFIAIIPVLIAVGALAFYRRSYTLPVVIVVPLLVLLPWIARNYGLTGHPFGFSWVEIFADNGGYDGHALWRVYESNAGGAFGFRPLMRATLLGVTNLFERMGQFLGGTVLVGLFLLSCLHAFRRKRIQVSRWFWVGSFLMVAVFSGCLLKLRSPEDFPHLNGLMALLPVAAGFGSGFLYVLIDRMRLPSAFFAYPILIIIILIQSLPFGVRLLQRTPPRFAFPPYFPPSIILTNGFMDEREIITTDIPWAYAWYADRPTVWLPHEREDFFSLNDFNLPMSAMILTPYAKQVELLGSIQNGQYRAWSDLVLRRRFENPPLPVIEVIPPDGVDYLLLTNKPRIR